MNELTSSQKAVMALEVEERLAVEAQGRRLAGLKQNRGESLRNELRNGDTDPSRNYLRDGDTDPSRNTFIKGEARTQAASLIGVNHQYVTDAKKIRRQAPELLEPIRDGLITIPQAKKIAALSLSQRTAVIEQVKGGVILAQALHQAPQEEKQDDLPMEFGSGWPRAMHKLWVFFTSLESHGGIALLSRRWKRDVKRNYLIELRRVRGAMDKCIEYLEKELKK